MPVHRRTHMYIKVSQPENISLFSEAQVLTILWASSLSLPFYLKGDSNPNVKYVLYEGCSNMNASSFITFFTYMLRQNVIHFWKELFLAFPMAPNIKKHLLFFSSYRPLYKGRSSILNFF